LLAAGVPVDAIENDLRTSRYRPVHRGVYAIGPLSPRGHMVAAQMAGGPTAAFCFASALVTHGLATTRATIDMTLPTNRRDSDQLRFHRLTLAANEVTRRDGLRTTTIERTLLDLAAAGVDISPLAHEATAKKLTTKLKLKNAAERHKHHRGAPALRRVAGEPHIRGRLERPFLAFLNANELPQPLTNHRIGPYTVDFLYPDHRLVVETDEDAHQSTWAFEEDRKRDRYLVAHGYRVMRVTAPSLSRRLARELSEALASPTP
jgi:hypothetical protein